MVMNTSQQYPQGTPKFTMPSSAVPTSVGATAARPKKKNRGLMAALIAIGAAAGLVVQATFFTNLVDFASSALNRSSQIQQAEPAEQNPWGQAGNPGIQEQQSEGNSKLANAKQSKGVAFIDASGPNLKGAGTGMVVKSDGTILTNYHVIEGSTDVRVTLASNGQSYQAKVLGRDPVNDVAVLKIEASGLETVKTASDGVKVGEQVTTVGNANGEGQLVASQGSVTAVGQRVEISGSAGADTMVGMIRTSTGAVPGDSGGPTYNSKNEVVGITSAGSSTNTTSAQTTSFVIPINYAMDVVNQVLSGKTSGSVTTQAKPLLGVTVSPAISESGQRMGALVREVSGPAADAGIPTSGVIVSIAGQQVKEVSDVTAILATHHPGDKVSVQILTDSPTPKDYEVVLGENEVN